MLPNTILKECKQFLDESKCRPLLRALPTNGEGFRRIKVRKKSKYLHPLEKHFDTAFQNKYKEIRLRSMIVQTTPLTWMVAEHEPFYVFPIDGYKILYNKQVTDYTQYAAYLHGIIDSTKDYESLLSQLFEYAYETSSLPQAIDSGAEILIYDIPYYYAIRASLVENYSNFVTLCND